MMELNPTSLGNVGGAHPVVIACDCGETHTASAKIVASAANPALATSVISIADFQAQRAWIGEHRAHGGTISQPSRAA